MSEPSTAKSVDRWIRRIKIALILAGVFLLVGLGNPYGFDIVVEAGRNLYQTNLVADYLRGVAWAAALTLTLFFWPVRGNEKRTLFWLWLAKCEMMLGFMLYYEWNYGLDAPGYWLNGKPGYQDLSHLAFGDGKTLVKVMSRLHWTYLVDDSYHAMKVSFGYLGLIGTFFFYRAACAYIRRTDSRILFLLGLVPSALQWSSILGKDPVTHLGVGLYTWGVVQLYRKPSFLTMLGLVGGVVLSAAIRPWMGAILLAPLAALGVTGLRGFLSKMIFAVAIIGAFVVSLAVFSSALKISSVDDVVEQSQNLAGDFASGGSGNESGLEHDNSIQKMIVFAPLGMVSALVRPFPGEVLNAFGLLAGLENAALLFLLVQAIRRSRLSAFKDPVLLWALSLILAWSLIYGFVCFHNAGTSVRYRFQILPIFLGLLVYLGRRRPKAEPAMATG